MQHKHLTLKLAEEAIRREEQVKISSTTQQSLEGNLLAVKGTGKLLRRVKLRRISKEFEIEQYVDSKKSTLKAREDYSHIFLLSSPDLYFGLVEPMVMPIALYLGMWITQYMVLAKTLRRAISA